jgi:hypothetical protein
MKISLVFDGVETSRNFNGFEESRAARAIERPDRAFFIARQKVSMRAR